LIGWRRIGKRLDKAKVSYESKFYGESNRNSRFTGTGPDRKNTDARTGVFGALLNTHLHYHCIVVDGIFLDATAIGEVQAAVRRGLLWAVKRRGLLYRKMPGSWPPGSMAAVSR
jgi:hypothetical protein